jgi:hypothetical protein
MGPGGFVPVDACEKANPDEVATTDRAGEPVMRQLAITGF